MMYRVIPNSFAPAEVGDVTVPAANVELVDGGVLRFTNKNAQTTAIFCPGSWSIALALLPATVAGDQGQDNRKG